MRFESSNSVKMRFVGPRWENLRSTSDTLYNWIWEKVEENGMKGKNLLKRGKGGKKLKRKQDLRVPQKQSWKNLEFF